jgi:hypothetical protein
MSMHGRKKIVKRPRYKAMVPCAGIDVLSSIMVIQFIINIAPTFVVPICSEFAEIDTDMVKMAVRTFVHSCAGYSVATYVLVRISIVSDDKCTIIPTCLCILSRALVIAITTTSW